MTSFREQLLAACKAKASPLGRKLTAPEVFELAVGVGGAVKPPRKKADIMPEAREVYDLYPRHENLQASLAAITKAINEDGFDVVRDKAREYGEAVKHWQHNRKKSANGSSLIPLPSTWFSNKRYFDDSKEWWAGTGASLAKAEKQATEVVAPPPDNWQAALKSLYPDVRADITWNEIPADIQARCRGAIA